MSMGRWPQELTLTKTTRRLQCDIRCIITIGFFHDSGGGGSSGCVGLHPHLSLRLAKTFYQTNNPRVQHHHHHHRQPTILWTWSIPYRPNWNVRQLDSSNSVSCCTAVQCQWSCLCWGWDSKKLLLPLRDVVNVDMNANYGAVARSDMSSTEGHGAERRFVTRILVMW